MDKKWVILGLVLAIAFVVILSKVRDARTEHML